MRRGGAAVLLVVAAVGLAGLLAEAAMDKRDLAFTIGVVPSIAAAELRPGATACQAPIDVPAEFSRVRFSVRGRAGQPLQVTVIGIPSGRQLATGRASTGDPTAAVRRVAADRKVGVCVRNDGSSRVALYGNAGAAAPLSAALIGRRQLGNDIAFVFLDDRRSMLGRLSDAFEHASRFRPGFVGPWLYWVLAAAGLIGVPLLLARAVGEATRAP